MPGFGFQSFTDDLEYLKRENPKQFHVIALDLSATLFKYQKVDMPPCNSILVLPSVDFNGQNGSGGAGLLTSSTAGIVSLKINDPSQPHGLVFSQVATRKDFLSYTGTIRELWYAVQLQDGGKFLYLLCCLGGSFGSFTGGPFSSGYNAPNR